MGKIPLVALGLGLLAACGSDPSGKPLADASASEPAAAAVEQTGWNRNPVSGVELQGSRDSLLVSTGPHAVVWPGDGPVLAPPYTVRAVLEKRSGRIHEGYGLVFGGVRLDRAEEEQAYSYFLIRGDGSFLIRRREGSSLPILRGWTSDPAIRRDTDEGARPNELLVEVGTETTVFHVNGGEVARIPTAELRVNGVAGVRVAHDLNLRIAAFSTATLRPPGRSR